MMVSGTQPDSPRPAIEQDGAETGADSATAGLIPPIRSQGDWQAVQALAAILEPEAFDLEQPADGRWREATQWVAIAHAAKVITEGYVRMSVDDATVERVARALAEHDGYEWCEGPDDDESTVDNPANPGYYRPRARAAVQALRDDPEPAPVHHDCCPHCTAWTGSCVRCGVRDAEEGEQLCGQCDMEVEAEVAAERALRDGGQQ